ncbi:MAG: hypothetical protein QOF10_5908 [Kribbellaceae bacterium]|nr:hypothetical protein [Kribbellaceae bacterium]
MRLLKLLLPVVLLAATALTPAAAAPAVQADEVAARLATIPGLRIESSSVVGGKPFFVLRYTQPADHKKPNGAKFEQRVTLWHRGFDRPTVLHTTGYGGVGGAFTSEPTRLVDGNQLNVEQRFFNSSTPAGPDWSKLNIWQAASDHHRIVQAFKKALYSGKWVSTGASKGGMTSVYHRRFYPDDVDATVAYVAPQDVDNRRDSYVGFIQDAGTDPQCNLALRNLQRNALLRRPAMVAKLAEYAAQNGLTYESTFGSVDRAFEAAVLDTPFAFWQYSTQASCPLVPGSATATDQQLFEFIDRISGWSFYSDEGTASFLPYYFQATQQLNWPDVASKTTWLKGLFALPRGGGCAGRSTGFHRAEARAVRDGGRGPLAEVVRAPDALRVRRERSVERREVRTGARHAGLALVHGPQRQPRLQHRRAADGAARGGHGHSADVDGCAGQHRSSGHNRRSRSAAGQRTVSSSATSLRAWWIRAFTVPRGTDSSSAISA